MSEDIYAEPDLTKKVRFQTGEKSDRNADVYKTTDNVNIYDNYLPQGSKPLELQDSTTVDQQRAISINAPSGGRNLLRPAAIFLVLLCLLFLAAVIFLVVLLIQDKSLISNLTRARDELQTSNDDMKSLNANLTLKINRLEKENDLLKVIESNLTKERDELQRQQESSSCPDNWIRFGNSCYLIPNLRKIWAESRSFCENQNAQLVIISSEEEQKFVSSFSPDCWIGLKKTDNQWIWVNGSVATQKYWAPTQPDNWGDVEDCVQITLRDHLNNWNDLQCSSQRDIICEKILE